MSTMTKKSKSENAAANRDVNELPKQGDQFRCEQCGMAIEVTAGCNCKDPDHVHFKCCGQDMAKLS